MRGLIIGAIALLAAGLLSLSAAQAAFKLDGRPKVAMLHLATVNDGGWSEALDRARVKTEETLGLKIAFSEKVPEDGAVVLQLVDRYVREGYNIIIGTSWGFSDAFLKAARKYPHVAFLNCAGATTAPNLESFYARTYQGWYLAGIIAGHLTRTEKIGAIGSYRMGPVTWDLNAFLRGAQSVNPAVEMIGIYVNTWYDPIKETQAAESLLAQGVDVLGSNLSAPGPHRAFQDWGKWSVGFQIDMSGVAPRGVATSMVYKWEAYLIPTIRAIVRGRWEPELRGWWKGLDAGVFDVDPVATWVPRAAVADVERARTKMITGELDPFQGPLYRNNGTLAVPEGKVPSDTELRRMNYLIQGAVDISLAN